MQPQFTPQQRREMIAKIRQLPAQLEVVVRDLTPVQLTTHYLAGEWTVAQNVHHLADSHINSFVRLKLILTEDKPTLKPYNQDAWATRVDADNPSIETSLQLLRGLHARWSALLESLAESDWLRAGL
ncbi:MAG: DinB family protein, partial [Chloroflexi bacterium]|nr:DinB family protein [Chloroflexota bacterium]